MISLGKEFIKNVQATCQKKLSEIGMKKRSMGVATIELDNGFSGWVGLNKETGYGDGCMRINPNVGLRFEPAHKLIAEINGEKPNANCTPLFSKNVGYLMPDRDSYIQFIFNRDSDIEPVAIELANTIKEFGFPYMKKFANSHDVLTGIKEEAFWDYAGMYKLATSYILGASIEELEIIVNEQKAIAITKNRNVQYFINFSEKFFKRVAHSA